MKGIEDYNTLETFPQNHGQHKNMVINKKKLIFQGYTVKLKPNLSCKSYCIYVVKFTKCDSNCVGQTKNSKVC